MGRRIVYCDECGGRILEDDLSRGKAIQVEGRYFCAGCRPSDPVPPRPPAPEPPRAAVPARRGPPRAHTTVARSAAAAQRSPVPALLAGLAILISLVAIVLYGTGSGTEPQPAGSGAPPPLPETGGSPPEGPKPPPPGETAGIWAELERFGRERADDPRAVADRCSELAPKLAGTPYESKAKAVRAEARLKRKERGAAVVVDDLLKRAREGSVADKAGIKARDALVEVDRAALSRDDPQGKLREILKQVKDGVDVPVVVIRDKKRVTLKARWPQS